MRLPLRLLLVPLCALSVAACEPSRAPRERPVVAAGHPASAAPPVEASFEYQRTYLLDRAHFGLAYADAEGRQLVVPSTAPEPSEEARVARIRYVPRAATPEPLVPIEGGAPTTITRVGDVLSVTPVPIEEAELHLVASFLTACANIDRITEVLASDDDQVRLVLPRYGSIRTFDLTAAGRAHIRYRRVPAHELSFLINACAGSETASVRVTAVAVPP